MHLIKAMMIALCTSMGVHSAAVPVADNDDAAPDDAYQLKAEIERQNGNNSHIVFENIHHNKTDSVIKTNGTASVSSENNQSDE
ncbi:hypothetical protein CT0861_06402 [Colletotrichum tofieldiae]|uniref:Secreted protein n=1 Tax=Colletotrichum tofieldiae TaxID=708197 RepID=A0A161V4I4_9PEZI|nr:hypothetical protein CT0861_06402 [Colletotrichum tofieldiae]GKT90730.1 hypothetical protein Ct61P_08580 [Colletotrichum tofieldiae]